MYQPKMRKKNGYTLVEVVLSKPINDFVAINVSKFCKNYELDVFLEATTPQKEGFPLEKFDCKYFDQLSGLGNKKWRQNLMLKVQGEDALAQDYALRVYRHINFKRD